MWTTFTQQVGMLVDPAYQQLVFIGLGALFVVTGLPFAMNLIKPNPIGGVRTRKTLSDPRIWYLANSYWGKASILIGIITIVFAVVLHLTAMPPATYSSICVLVLLGGLMVASVATLIYVWRVK
jgi:uncharacterized membrane protein